MPELRVKHTSGATSTLNIVEPDDLGESEDEPSLAGFRIDRDLFRDPNATDSAECIVYRDGWADVREELDAVDDEFYIHDGDADVFGGRLKDDQLEGVTVSVLLEDGKRDAIDAEPSGGNETYEKADEDILRDELLDRVGTVEAGAVDQQISNIPFEESHASPGKSITKLSRATGAEVLYGTGGSPWHIDYVGRVGADRTEETLSAATQTVISDPRVRHNEIETVTHVVVLGSQQGTAQIRSEETVDATTDREIYRVKIDKDIQRQDRADELAGRLADEYADNPEYAEVEFAVPASVEPELGDEFTVDLPKHDIDDAELRVVEWSHIVDAGGERYSLVLSNRELSRELDADARAQLVDEFGSGNAGQYYALADGEGWDGVAPANDYAFSFYRPADTIQEFRAVLQLESRPFRSRFDAKAHSHSVTLSVGDHAHEYTLYAPNHLHFFSESGALITEQTTTEEGHEHEYEKARRTNGITESTKEVQETSEAGGSFTASETSDETVGVEPGIVDTDETVSNVDVTIGGTTVASGLSAPIDETINIEGVLGDGANPVVVSSETLGEVRATIEYEGLKNASRD